MRPVKRKVMPYVICPVIGDKNLTAVPLHDLSSLLSSLSLVSSVETSSVTSLLEDITHADDEEVRMKIAKRVSSLIEATSVNRKSDVVIEQQGGTKMVSEEIDDLGPLLQSNSAEEPEQSNKSSLQKAKYVATYAEIPERKMKAPVPTLPLSTTLILS